MGFEPFVGSRVSFYVRVIAGFLPPAPSPGGAAAAVRDTIDVAERSPEKQKPPRTEENTPFSAGKPGSLAAAEKTPGSDILFTPRKTNEDR